MKKPPDWTVLHFAMAAPEDRAPTLLRRVARHIEKLAPEYVLDIVVKSEDGDMVATVYHTKPKPQSNRDPKAKSRGSSRRKP
jgi:hypothetical protein